MRHIRIVNNGNNENVSHRLLEYLMSVCTNSNDYYSNDYVLDSSSDLVGILSVTKTYRLIYDYLKFHNSNLIINNEGLYIYLKDPTIRTLYANRYGDGVGITDVQAQSTTAFITLRANTSVQTFDELNLFTNITVIPNEYCLGTSNLISINLQNISELGELSFRNSGITGNIELPALTTFNYVDLNRIKNYCNYFDGCVNLTYVNLSGKPNGILGNAMFAGCTNLIKVEGLENITEISSLCFSGCEKLETLDLNGTIILNPGETFKNCYKLISLGNNAKIKFESSSGNQNTFKNCQLLENIDLSESLYLPDIGFHNCTSLNNITLNSSVIRIPRECFYRCQALETLNTSNIKYIDNDAFKECSLLNNLDLSNCETIGDNSFLNCSALTTITNTNKITSIGQYGLKCAKLSGPLSFPLLETIKISAFESTSVSSISLPNIDTSICEGYIFYHCQSLISASLNNNATSLTPHMFDDCRNLETITNTNNITTVNDSCFMNCYKLNNISMPNLQTVEINGFRHCEALTNIGNTGLTITYIGTLGFDTTRIDLDLSNVTYIDNQAFWQNKGLITADLSSCQTLGERVFYECTELKTITFSSYITEVPYETCRNCRSLKTVNLHQNTKIIGKSAFQSSPISNIDLQYVTTIKEGALYTCGNIDHIIFNNIEIIENNGISYLYNCRYIKFNVQNIPVLNTNAIDISSTQRDNGFKIFVPDDQVADYKAMLNSVTLTYVYPMSSFSTYFPND